MQLQAQEEARKSMQKSFSATGNSLKVANKFGKVHINTNRSKQINVKIEIIVRASSKEKAEEILNAISIANTQSSGLISFETLFEKSIEKKRTTSIEVNYTIDIPETSPLEVSNKFGNIYLADFSGQLKLKNIYGSTKTEKIKGNSEKYIEVKFGNADISYLEKGTIYIAYGKYNIFGGKEVTLKSAYSNGEVGEITDLQLKNAYGDIEIDKVDNISGESHYGKFRLKNLYTSLTMKGAYNSTFKIEGISKSCQNIDINMKYTSSLLSFREDAGCQFIIELQYGSFIGEKERFDIQKKMVENSFSYYEGKFGRGDFTKVKMSSRYGDIRIR
ncbi:MAG: hypothetical protein OHK0045_06830 [Raineya sp.]